VRTFNLKEVRPLRELDPENIDQVNIIIATNTD
jgi:hypothetical protein